MQIVRQARDDDCGVAALITLLKMAGVLRSEKDLLAAAPISQKRRVRGLSALDLRGIIENTGTGLELEGAWHSEMQLVEAVQRHPVLVLLYETVGVEKNKQVPTLGHYVVLEAWSPRHGFLVVDPGIGKRGFLRAADTFALAHRRQSGAVQQALVMSLRRDGETVGQAASVTPDEERRLPTLLELRRLPNGLPTGKTLATLAIGGSWTRARLGGDDPFDIASQGLAASMTVQRGIGNGGILSWSASLGRENTALKFPENQNFTVDRQRSIGPLQLGYTRQVSFNMPRAASASMTSSAAVNTQFRPIAISAGGSMQIQLGRNTLIAGLDATLSRARGSSPPLTVVPSIGVARSLGSRLEIGTLVSAYLPVRSDMPKGDVALSADVSINQNWSVGLYASQAFGSQHNVRSRQLGLSVTFALPNWLR
ncbi:MAG TPA: cysteine peptidase family C39 domain-containing protein [Allosphingosinicella sp.]